MQQDTSEKMKAFRTSLLLYLRRYDFYWSCNCGGIADEVWPSWHLFVACSQKPYTKLNIGARQSKINIVSWNMFLWICYIVIIWFVGDFLFLASFGSEVLVVVTVMRRVFAYGSQWGVWLSCTLNMSPLPQASKTEN